MSETTELEYDIDATVRALAEYGKQKGVPGFVAEAAQIWAVERTGLRRALDKLEEITNRLNAAYHQSAASGERDRALELSKEALELHEKIFQAERNAGDDAVWTGQLLDAVEAAEKALAAIRAMKGGGGVDHG